MRVSLWSFVRQFLIGARRLRRFNWQTERRIAARLRRQNHRALKRRKRRAPALCLHNQHAHPGPSLFTLSWTLALGASATSLELHFNHTWDGAPLRLNAPPEYSLPTGEALDISRVSYLLSGFALERAEGGWFELTNQFAWIDAERGRTTADLQNISRDQYRAVRFTVGLDPKTNEGDPAQYPASHPLNPNLNGLHWSWQGGYIFLALEGRFAAHVELTGFSYHLARNTNRTAVTLPVNLDLTGGGKTLARTHLGQSFAEPQTLRLEVVFDLAALMNGPRPISPQRNGVSTHSRDGDPLAAALRANLSSAFQIREIVGGAQSVTATATNHKLPLYLPAKYTPYPFHMSAKFPVPDFPADNPLLVERVELGERLFNEPRLSRNGKVSCASCHVPGHAFADPRRYSAGVDGRPGRRNAMPLFNLAWKSSFFWDGRAPSLRAQALMPIQDHLEMDESLSNVCAKLQSTPSSSASASGSASSPRTLQSATAASTNDSPDYPALFTRAFGAPEITPEKIGLAIENYLLTLTSFDSKFDRAMRGQGELSETEKRGFDLFFTEFDPRTDQHGADCFHCHGGALFTDNQFHNNGLAPIPPYPPPPPGPGFPPEDRPAPEPPDPGRYHVTHDRADRGKFVTPSLRNVALTAPYMHDGRFSTLEEVIQHYCTGVHPSPTLDPNLAKHPDGLPLSAQDQKALVAFLKTLTDEKFQQ